jgi:peptidoglycan DL-endopeptidase RipA
MILVRDAAGTRAIGDQVRSVQTVVLMVVLIALVAGALPAAAQPPPPPPNPSDQELDASGETVARRAEEVGRLSTRVAELDRQAAEAQAPLAARREEAYQRLLALQAARTAADEAARRAADARVGVTAAGAAIDAARERMDAFVAVTYQQTLDLGPLGLLTEAVNPEDLLARAEFTELVAQEQLRALDGLWRAEIEKVNAESAARAAEEEALARAASAEQARTEADSAVAAAGTAAGEQEAALQALTEQRRVVEQQLDAARLADIGLRGQRERFVDYQRRVAAEQEERRRAAAAAAEPSEPGPPPEIDRAAAQLGPQYECRSRTPRWGPVKPWVSEAGQLLRCRFGVRTVGGVGPRPNPSDHPSGLALDFMVDRPTGDALADCAVRNADRLAVKYVIYRQRINTGSGWTPMEDRGSPVANHMEHVHVSFRSAPGRTAGALPC